MVETQQREQSYFWALTLCLFRVSKKTECKISYHRLSLSRLTLPVFTRAQDFCLAFVLTRFKPLKVFICAHYIAIVLALFVCSPTTSLAVLPDEILDNPALETRARALSRDLRCLVCQNETIDESLSPLARDLRLLIRERLLAGDSDRKIFDFITRRYGDFIRLTPPFNLKTIPLWLSPVLILGATLSIIFIRLYSERT